MKPGTRLKSSVCDTEVVVVRPPSGEVVIECGGCPMDGDGGTISPDHSGGSQMGKRYMHEASGLELLCVKPGDGSLSVGGEALVLKDAKQLPSSD